MNIDCKEADEIDGQFPGALNRIAEEICEHIWDESRVCPIEEGDDESVTVVDIQKQNATNQAIVGSFWLGGVEYAFEAESGDNFGWVWRTIAKDLPIPEIKIVQKVWALQPTSQLIREAVDNKRGPSLLKMWRLFKERPEVAELPGSYSYDRHFAPDGKTESYWKAKALSLGFVLVGKETADATAAMLEQAK